MTSFTAALVAALVLIGVGVALHSRIKAELAKMRADFARVRMNLHTEMVLLHSRINMIADHVVPETPAQAADVAPPQPGEVTGSVTSTKEA